MSQTDDLHSRRLGDLLTYVQSVVDEVNAYISSGRNNPRKLDDLTRKQAASMAALQQAMEMQQELLDQLSSGTALPSRRVTDPQRGKPNLTTVESLEIDTIRRLAGIES